MAVSRLAFFVLLIGSSAFADDRRAQVNYMLHCQGCHLPEAEGFDGKVPPISNFAGYFLHSAEGRDFLIRVPGVAGSALRDSEIAELMNWLLQTYSENQLPDPYAPFTESEVAALRANPEPDPAAAREAILGRLAAEFPLLASELQKNN
jgi:mono/diheme cytochrome c family protein